MNVVPTELSLQTGVQAIAAPIWSYPWTLTGIVPI
jgi:hypothetical protein